MNVHLLSVLCIFNIIRFYYKHVLGYVITNGELIDLLVYDLGMFNTYRESLYAYIYPRKEDATNCNRTKSIRRRENMRI